LIFLNQMGFKTGLGTIKCVQKNCHQVPENSLPPPHPLLNFNFNFNLYIVKKVPTSTSNLTVKFNSNFGSDNFSVEKYPSFTQKWPGVCFSTPPTQNMSILTRVPCGAPRGPFSLYLPPPNGLKWSNWCAKLA
jgi:hypothetical protein